MKYGSILPEWFNIPSFAFALAKDLDKTEKGNPFAELTIQPGDVVLDFGCFIGSFASAAIESGARKVVTYEAEPRNYAFAKENLLRYGSKVIFQNAAVTDSNAKSVTFFKTGFPGCNSLIEPPTKSKQLTVRAVSFRGEIQRHRPNVFKLDIEGAEYAILRSLRDGDLNHVREFFIEYHKHPDRDATMLMFDEYVARNGFTKTENSKLRKTVYKRNIC